MRITASQSFDRPIIALLQLLITVLLLVIGVRAGLGVAWYAGVALATLLFVHQQRLIRNRERQACFRAFLSNNVYGGIVFAGLVIDTLPGV